MFRKVAALTAVVVVEAGLLLGLGGVAWASPLSGRVTCNPLSGTGHFNHQIATNGTAPSVTMHFTGTSRDAMEHSALTR